MSDAGGLKRKHDEISSSDDSAAMEGAAATAIDESSPASKRARLVALPVSADDLVHLEAQRVAHATNSTWRGCRILVDTTLEVLADSTVLVHLDVAIDTPARRAAKKLDRAALTNARHREKKAHQKLARKSAKQESRAQRAVEEARLRAEGMTTEEVRAHFRSINTKAYKPSTRAGKAHRAELREQMRKNELPKVVIDLSFDALMKLEEVCSLAKQIKYIYGHNIRSPKPLHLILASLAVPPADFRAGDAWNDKRGANALEQSNSAAAAAATSVTATAGAPAEPAPAAAASSATAPSSSSSSSANAAAPAPEMYTRTVLSRLDGFDRLAFDRTELPYTALPNVPRDKLVYLTAESDNVLHSIDKDKVYVIGGIVDHNRMKGLCHRLALEAGIPTARLPIPEYLTTHRRTVITVNQVFEILLHAQEKEPCDWAAVFKEVLPTRSNWQERSQADGSKTSHAAAGASDAAAADQAEDDEAMEEREDEERNERLQQADDVDAEAEEADADADADM